MTFKTKLSSLLMVMALTAIHSFASPGDEVPCSCGPDMEETGWESVCGGVTCFFPAVYTPSYTNICGSGVCHDWEAEEGDYDCDGDGVMESCTPCTGSLSITASAAANVLLKGGSISISSSPVGGVAPYTYSWSIPGSSATGVQLGQRNPGSVTFTTEGVHNVAVTVTDSNQLSATGSVTVRAVRVDPVVLVGTQTAVTAFSADSTGPRFGIIKGAAASVNLGVSISPDDSTTRAALTWSGAVVSGSTALQATVSADNAALRSVEVKVNGSTAKSAKVFIIWIVFDNFQTVGPKPADSSVEPPTWGVSPDSNQNGVLIRAKVQPLEVVGIPGITYDFKRTMHKRIAVGSPTATLAIEYLPPTDDDTYGNNDEDLTPSASGYIYVEDPPGSGNIFSGSNAAWRGRWNFIQTAEVQLAPGQGFVLASDPYLWQCSVSLVRNGPSNPYSTWVRGPSGENYINTGHQTMPTGNAP